MSNIVGSMFRMTIFVFITLISHLYSQETAPPDRTAQGQPSNRLGLAELAEEVKPGFLLGAHVTHPMQKDWEKLPKAQNILTTEFNALSVGIYQKQTQQTSRDNWFFDDTGVHARQRLARRWLRIASRPRGCARSGCGSDIGTQCLLASVLQNLSGMPARRRCLGLALLPQQGHGSVWQLPHFLQRGDDLFLPVSRKVLIEQFHERYDGCRIPGSGKYGSRSPPFAHIWA